MRLAPIALMLICLAAPAAWGPSALGQTTCTEPVAPAPVDGATITVDQLRAAIADAKSFIALSDVYQSCLTSEAQAMSQPANPGDKPAPPPGLAEATNARIAANQKQKEKVGASINAAIGAYKDAHAPK